MFWFTKKKKKAKNKGRIEAEFAWLSAEQILDDFERDSGEAQAAVTALVRLSILGGIMLKRTLDKSDLLERADPDEVVIEGAGFVWSFLFRNCFKTGVYNVHDHVELSKRVHMGTEILHTVLESNSGRNIPKKFAARYPSHDLIGATDRLIGKLLEAAGIGMLEGVKDQLGTRHEVTRFASEYLTMQIDASSELLKIACRSV